MLIVHMEMRSDWPQLVEAVPCQTCGAIAGVKCRSLSATPGTLSAQLPRSDYHTERKYLAVSTYQASLDQAREAAASVVMSEPEATAAENAEEPNGAIVTNTVTNETTPDIAEEAPNGEEWIGGE